MRDSDGVPRCEQTAWQSGRTAAVAAAKDGRLFGFASTVTTCALPTVVGFATTHLPVVPQVILIALSAVVGYLLVPTIWALGVAIRAPVLQRNDAREEAAAARELERTMTLKWEITRLYHQLARHLHEWRVGSEHHLLTAVQLEHQAELAKGTMREVCSALREAGYVTEAELVDYPGLLDLGSAPFEQRMVMLASWTRGDGIGCPLGQEPHHEENANILALLREEADARLSGTPDARGAGT
jgi:hypothetical protein